MTGRSKETRVDPELARQLDEAGADDTVQAVVYLRSTRSLNPDSVNRTAQRVIESASTKAGTRPDRVNVMRYIGTVAVEGPASFVRALIDETDVTSALANVHPDEDPLMGTVSGAEPPGTDAATAADDEPKPTRSASLPKTRTKAPKASAGPSGRAGTHDTETTAAASDEHDRATE